MTLHEIPLQRRTLRGHFSPDREPVRTVEPGDSIAFAALNAVNGVKGIHAVLRDDAIR
jgi:acetamidase/formamidase